MSKVFTDEDFQIASACRACSTCVAVAHKDNVIAIRDTKDKSKVTLQFTKEEWQSFITGVKNGEFDF